MKKNIGKKGNIKAAIYFVQLLENEQFVKDRDHTKKLTGLAQALAIRQLVEDYRLTDFMLQEVFHNFPTLGTKLGDINVCKISENLTGSLGFPLKIEISSLAAREDVIDFILKSWPQMKKYLEKGHAIPRIKTPTSQLNSDVNFLIYWMKKQGSTAKIIKDAIKKKFDLTIMPNEITARYSNEVKRRRTKITGSG